MTDRERFGGIARLYSEEGADKIAHSRAAVVGIGGVGSWAAEALARSGVGTIILLDLDDICLTNTNRQIHALEGQYGRPKVDVMAERLRLINPAVRTIPIQAFYTPGHPERLFDEKPDVVIDAIDSMKSKCHLIAECRTRGVPIVTCGGAGGRIDPSRIAVADLARTCGDNMLSQLRKILRQQYDFPLYDRCPEIGIPCVYSSEKPRFARCDGSVSLEREAGHVGRISCHAGFGSAAHITGSFGLMMAGLALNILCPDSLSSSACSTCSPKP
ncbi:MAG TPA: tRNA threonylcarbamoyladenosine dehydratase [Candidatus Akkermansia intestinigallinarum]|uniref:tRNA threonylcarbamoyladenosine dehydratase n=1 Tax=Candidatus Akkermansia intestinigallinarum TaxID=2838431 RepID=A0A9D1VC70_9BACT|nr:tRNA threonylcarbamoyladenosine dehydratase [Candidatus Akkermansia intestinigallinarum]